MEGKLARKKSREKRHSQRLRDLDEPVVVEGKSRPRDQPPVSAATTEVSGEEPEDLTARVSPAQERATDAVVQRATKGLMRLNSRRMVRACLRRLLWLMVLAAAIGAVAYWLTDIVPAELVRQYWDELQEKLRLAFSPE